MAAHHFILGLSLALVAACDPSTATSTTEIPFETGVEGIGKADHNTLELTPVHAAVDFDVLNEGGRFIITSADSWEEHMGTDAPDDVDFAHEWVAFYGLGSRNTGGYGAEIHAIHNLPGWGGLLLETEDFSPGHDCLVTQAFTTPHAIVKFEVPAPRPSWATVDNESTVTKCGPDNADRLAELEASLELWEQAKAEAGNSYAYARESFSFFGQIGSETDFVVEDGVVVERHFKSSHVDGSSHVSFSEIGDEVGNDLRGHRVATIDDLYEECRTEVLTQSEDDNFMSFSLDDDGLLQTCTYFPMNCADDCTFGVTIASIDL